MKNLCVTGAYPGWTYIGEIIDEMQAVGQRFATRHPELAAEMMPLEPILVDKFPELDFDFCFCFRCLKKDSGGASKARLYKNDNPNSFNKNNNTPESSRTLGFDIVVYTEDFEPIKKDKSAQKLMLGKELIRFLKLTLLKYIKKIPMSKEETNDILATIEDWLIGHHWLLLEGEDK
ncbi:MAG: hypothetical protein LBU76_08940 [Azoarcus sp.]|jgi:hypothetical protein|nr:hypothetical protein [Azoarcus sp.]